MKIDPISRLIAQHPVVRSTFGNLSPLLAVSRKRGVQTSILVVDESPEITEVIALYLRQAGFRVDTANDGIDAWDAMQASDYDLLITELAIPRLSGVDLILKVRAMPSVIPVIILAGFPPWGVPMLELLLGPGTLIAKPFSFSKLLANVIGLLTTDMDSADAPRSPESFLSEADAILPVSRDDQDRDRNSSGAGLLIAGTAGETVGLASAAGDESS